MKPDNLVVQHTGKPFPFFWRRFHSAWLLTMRSAGTGTAFKFHVRDRLSNASAIRLTMAIKSKLLATPASPRA